MIALYVAVRINSDRAARRSGAGARSAKNRLCVSRILSMICVWRSCYSNNLLKLLIRFFIKSLSPMPTFVDKSRISVYLPLSSSLPGVQRTCPVRLGRYRAFSTFANASRAMALCADALKLSGSSLKRVYPISLSNNPSINGSLFASCLPAVFKWAFAALPSFRTLCENSCMLSPPFCWRFLNSVLALLALGKSPILLLRALSTPRSLGLVVLELGWSTDPRCFSARQVRSCSSKWRGRLAFWRHPNCLPETLLRNGVSIARSSRSFCSDKVRELEVEQPLRFAAGCCCCLRLPFVLCSRKER